MGVLVAAERDAAPLDAIVLGSPEQEAAPAGTDVEEALALLQHQLPADVLDLRFLGLRQRHAGVAEIGAGVDPLRIEPEGVELVGDVVVELDLARVGLGLVQGARAREVQELAQPPDRCRADGAGIGRVARHQLAADGHQVAHAALDLQAAFDVVFADLADLAGDDMAQWNEVLQPHRDGGAGGADALAAGQHDRQRQRQFFEALF